MAVGQMLAAAGFQPALVDSKDSGRLKRRLQAELPAPPSSRAATKVASAAHRLKAVGKLKHAPPNLRAERRN